MRNCYYAYLGFLFGLIGLIFLPLGFKVFAFFFPAIFLCISLNSEEYNFNLKLFLVILFPFIFIPHQMFTLDASQTFDANAMQGYVNTGMKIVVVFVYYGIPFLFTIMIIIAIIMGKVSSAAKLFVKGLLLMGALFIVLFVLVVIGADPTGGTIADIGKFYISLINFIISIPSMIYNLIRKLLDIINEILSGLEDLFKALDPGGNYEFGEIPTLPSLESNDINLSLDSSYQELNSMTYTERIYAIHDMLPTVITWACLIFAIFMTKPKMENYLVKKIGDLFGKDKEKKEKRHFSDVDLGMYVILAFILFFGWFLFLSYGRNFGHDPATDYIYLGYFGIYSVIIVACVLSLTTNEKIFYERSTAKNTLFGTLLGVITLRLIMSFFTQQTLNAYSNDELHRDISYVAIQVLFVAPAESLFFFVFCPGLVFGIILQKVNKKVKIEYESDRQRKLASIEGQKETWKKILKAPDVQKNKTLFALIQYTVDYLEKKEQRIKNKVPVIYLQKKAVLGRRNPAILFIAFGVFLPAFGFSLLHFPMLNYNTGISFVEFYVCGLFGILFCVGLFFILLHMSSGYQSSIWAHAGYNIFTVMFVLATLGV
ncbi:MAG: hypothetical protein ACFE8A_13505 [Candidatus Hodarchaeota archaeon]